jgi:hypothetical protein
VGDVIVASRSERWSANLDVIALEVDAAHEVLNDDAEGRLVDRVNRSGRRGVAEQAEAGGGLDASVFCKKARDPLGDLLS